MDSTQAIITTRQERALGQPVFVQGHRFYEVAALWLECKTAWLKSKVERSGWENTAKAYEQDWGQFYLFLTDRPEPVSLWNVDGTVAGAWKESLVSRNLSETSINRKLSSLSSYYSFAGSEFLVEIPGELRKLPLWPMNMFGNPFKQVRRIVIQNEDAHKRDWPSPDEMKRIIDAIPLTDAVDWRDMCALLFLFSTSRRYAECFNLKWGDLHESPRGYWFEYRNKGGKVKKQAMASGLYQAMVLYLQKANRWPLAEGDFVFVGLSDKAKRLRKAAQVVLPDGYELVEWVRDNGAKVELYEEVAKIASMGTSRNDRVTQVLRAEAAGELKIFARGKVEIASGMSTSPRNDRVVIGTVLGESVVGVDWVPGKEPLTNHSANSMFKRRAVAAGVDPKKAHWHGGRDSRAQQEWDGDTVSFADALYTQKLLGHKSMETTQRYGQKRFDLPVDKKADVVFAEMAPQQLKLEMAKGMKGS